MSAQSGIWEYGLGRKGLWDCQRLSPRGVFVLIPVSAFSLGILVKNGQAKNRQISFQLPATLCRNEDE